MIGYHTQDESVNEWDKAMSQMQAGTHFKFVNNHSAARVLGTQMSTAVNIFRQWQDDLQRFDSDDLEAYKAQAREIIGRFFNETFLKNAAWINYVESYNETLAASQNITEKKRRVLAELAFVIVWNEEYRNVYPELRHIRVCMLNTAPGNDLYGPAGDESAFARIAVQNDAALGYHPYIAVYGPDILPQIAGEPAPPDSVHIEAADHELYRAEFRHPVHPSLPYEIDTSDRTEVMSAIEQEFIPGQPSPGEWNWASGRWTVNDELFRSKGYYVKWLFTEAGPIRDGTGRGNMLPLDGWRHDRITGGDMAHYQQLLKYWSDNAHAWNIVHNNRAGTAALFTLPGHDQWKLFRHTTADLWALKDWSVNWWANAGTIPNPDPDPDPPGPDPCNHARTEYERSYVLLPMGASSEWAKAVIDGTWDKNRFTVGGSADDAGIGCGLKWRRVIIVNAEEWPDSLPDWYDTYYEGARLEYVNAVTPAGLTATLKEQYD